MRNIKKCFRGGLLVGALALSISSLVVGSVAAIAAPTPAYAASKKSSKKSKGGSVKGVKVKKKVDKYSWAELAKISDAMTKSGSRKAALEIAKEYKLCDKKGKLDGTQTKSVALSTGKTSVRIVGFYHDDLSDGSGKAGITWQFVDGMCNTDFLSENGARGFDNFKLMDTVMQGLAADSWLPSDLTSRLATVSVKTASVDSGKNGEAVSSDAKLWAPSAVEVLGDAKDMAGLNRDTEWMANALNAEGTQYDLFKDQGLGWDDQSGAFSDYPTSYFYTCCYSDDDFAEQNDAMNAMIGNHGTVKEGATPDIFVTSDSDDDQCVTVYRSLYLNPKTPDENFDNYAISIGQSKSSDPGRYKALTSTGDKVTQPLFCLTAAADDDSAAAESNGIAIQDSVDNYSWSDLKAIADEIADAANNGGDPYAVAAKYHLGDEDGAPTASSYKTVELKNGVTAKAYIVDYGYDDRADGKGKAGITFLFDDVVPFEAPMNKDGANSGGWKDSDLRKTLNKQFIKKLPKDLKNSIVKVKKLTNNSGVTTDVSSVTETEDALWLPSAMELFGTTEIEDEANGLIRWQPDQVPVYEAEGKLYLYHKLNGLLYRSDNDTPAAWTRSCDASQSGAFIVYNGFHLYSRVDADEAHAVFPGFCL